MAPTRIPLLERKFAVCHLEISFEWWTWLAAFYLMFAFPGARLGAGGTGSGSIRRRAGCTRAGSPPAALRRWLSKGWGHPGSEKITLNAM